MQTYTVLNTSPPPRIFQHVQVHVYHTNPCPTWSQLAFIWPKILSTQGHSHRPSLGLYPCRDLPFCSMTNHQSFRPQSNGHKLPVYIMRCKGSCWEFQQRSFCPKPRCTLSHQCGNCLSPAHGAHKCPPPHTQKKTTKQSAHKQQTVSSPKYPASMAYPTRKCKFSVSTPVLPGKNAVYLSGYDPIKMCSNWRL